MSTFTKLKLPTGENTRVNLSKVEYFVQVGKNTELFFDSGDSLIVADSFQTVSNRAAGLTEAPTEG